MVFYYEPISPASPNEQQFPHTRPETPSAPALYQQQEFYPDLYDIGLNNMMLDTLVSNSTTNSPSCIEQPFKTKTNYPKDADCSTLRQFSSNLESGSKKYVNSQKTSSRGPGPIRKKRSRIAYTRFQVSELEREFQVNKYLPGHRRVQLSHDLKLEESQIKVWFQNRRSRDKKQSQEAPAEILPLEISSASTAIPSLQIPPNLSSITFEPPQTPSHLPPTPSTTPTTSNCSELDEILDFITESTDPKVHEIPDIQNIKLELELSAHIWLLSAKQNGPNYAYNCGNRK